MFDIFEYKDKLKNWFVQKGRVITYASIDDDFILYLGTDPIESVDLLVHKYDLQFTQDTFIGEVGDTITVDVLLTDCDGAVSGETITLVGNNSEYTSNTNSQGVASFSISDLSESGEYTFVASYGTLEAECTVINALYFDDTSTNTTSRYFVNTASETTISYENNKIKMTCGTEVGRNGIELRNGTALPLENLKGKNIKFKVDLSGVTRKMNCNIKQTVGGSTTSNTDTHISTDGTITSNVLTIDENATMVRMQIIPNTSASGDIYYLTNWTVWAVDE